MLLGAYYYAWYADNWLSRTKRTGCPPVFGEYNNTVSSDLICQHFKLAKDHGIDFLSVSWAPGQDHNFLLEPAQKAGIKLTFFYESLLRVEKKGDLSETSLNAIMTDMEHISEYMDDSCWLRIHGKPVMMIYVTRAYRGNLYDIFRNIRSAFGRQVYLVGDHLFWKSMKHEGAVANFDAVTYYNMYQKGRFQGASEQEICENYLSTARDQLLVHKSVCERFNVPLWGTAMPGYDDTGVRPDCEHLPVPRMDGEFFRRSLADAKEMCIGKQAMMITSFNEWYEDTQIEPCSEYGTKYLEIVKSFSQSF